MIIRKLIIYFLNCKRIHRLRYSQTIFIIKNIVRNNVFTEYNISQFILFNNDYLAYIITFFIRFVRLRHFVIKKIIDNLDIEFDVIKVQSIRCENNLMLLF